MGNSTNITYGDYDFQISGGPIPFLNITREALRSDDGQTMGTRFIMAVEGTLTPLPNGLGGYINIDAMQDALLSGFSTDGLEFKVTCGASTLMSVYPKVNSISLPPSPDNWTITSPYSIQLTWEGEPITGAIFIDSANESWDVQIDDTANPYDWEISGSGDASSTFVNVSHNVSAKGIAHYVGGSLVRPAWQQAREWVIDQIGMDNEVLGSSGVINLTTGDFQGYNHARIQSYDEKAGSFSVQETWIAVDTGNTDDCNNAREDFTASVQYNISTDITTITVNGSIQGLETVSYGSSPGNYSLTQNKYSAASGYWVCVQPKLLGRATIIGDSIATRNINPLRTNLSVGHQPTAGIITYSYSYDDRPCNFITGSLVENISVADSSPTDVFASLTALGRAFGPILQDINTVTASIKSVNVDILMPIPVGCSDIVAAFNEAPNIDVLLCAIETDISGSDITYFKSQDQKSWNPKTGRFTQSVEWTYTPCSEPAPSTTFC